MSANLAASIHARLLARAKERGEDFQLVLTRYGLERCCTACRSRRLATSYLLKGALLFDLWFDVAHRPTRDADFLGFGPADATALRSVIREACAVGADDGMAYDPAIGQGPGDSRRGRYGGLRVTLHGRLATPGARCSSTSATATR